MLLARKSNLNIVSNKVIDESNEVDREEERVLDLVFGGILNTL